MRGLLDDTAESSLPLEASVARYDYLFLQSRGMSYRDSSEFLFLTCEVLYLPDDRDAKVRRGREGVCGYRDYFMCS